MAGEYRTHEAIRIAIAAIVGLLITRISKYLPAPYRAILASIGSVVAYLLYPL